MKETEETKLETGAEVHVDQKASTDNVLQELGYLKGKVEAQEKQIDELKKVCEENKKDIKGVSTTNAAGFIMLLVTVAALTFCIYKQNKTMVDYANAINNNSYSIESIITSIKGGPAVND